MSVSLSPRGLIAARFVKSLAIGGDDPLAALAFASSQGHWRTPDVVTALKSIVDAMTTTNAGSLAVPAVIFDDIIEVIRPRSLLDRIPGWRSVALRTAHLRFSGDALAGVVGEGVAIPLGRFSLERVTVEELKIASMILVSDESLRNTSQAADLALGQQVGGAIGGAMDVAAFDPSVSGSITNGATTIASSGITVTALDSDIASLIDVFSDGDSALDRAVFVMSARRATFLSLLRTSGGSLAYPNVTVRGGTLAGLPVYVSGALSSDSSPPTDAITLLDAAQVLVGDDRQVKIATAISGSLEMSDAPTNNSATGTATTQTSLLQTNAIAIRGIRWAGWERASDTAVASIVGIPY